ncbi:MAG TPA: TonB-dependent receptor [Longimicrobiales bacterium]|nr:TonB-dependent receptor [Longimicrobiales bacterium]
MTAALLLFAPGVMGQTGSIAGRVVDAQSGQTVPAAQVFISDLDLGVLTQQNGSYILLNVPVGQHTVTVQRIGYRQVDQTVAVAGGETAVLDFRITEEALQLDEIIITGTPGGTQRRAIGNTVTTVSVADVTQDVAITNMQDLLSARTPGLEFSRLSGNVGAGSGITIRGTGSFSSSRNQPIVFVDGIRVNNDVSAGPTVGVVGGDVNVLDDFNPEDIASIEIIKGPAAASLYGTEASAGVIQIITKRGQEGSPEFNVSIRQGVNYLADPAGRLGTMWTCPTDPAPGPTDCQNESDLIPYNMYDEANNYIRNGYFSWPTENLYSNGHSQSYNLDVRGGTQSIRYFLSGNYDDEQGFEWYNSDETFRLRGNVGVVFSESFSLDVSTGYVDGSTRFAAPVISDGGTWQDLLWSNGYFLDRVTPFGSPGSNPRLGGFQEHLPADVTDVSATREYSRFTGSATLNFTSGEFNFGNTTGSISSRGIVGIDKGWDINTNLFPLPDGSVPESLIDYCARNGRPAGCVPDEWSPVYSESVTGEMTYSRPISTNVSFDYSLTGRLNVADTWGLATSVGAQYYVDQKDNFSNSGNGFASPLSRTINQLAQSQLNTDYSLVENRSLGFYVQQEVSFNERVFLTGAIRFDDNSTFGTDSEAQRYPKVAATWVVSEESFWNVDLINSLRLRGAWGKAGRQPSAIAGQNIYVAIPGLGGGSAIRPASPGNPGILPEVSTEFEVGFDIALLDDRLSGEFTHYRRRDEQALLSIPLASSFGFPGSVDQNVGRIDNWGWEAQLSARVYESAAFSFDLDLAADHTDNEIKSLGDFPGSTGSNAILVGLPYPNYITGDWVVSAQADPAGTFVNAFGQRFSGQCDLGISLAPDPNAPDAGQYGRLPGGPLGDCADPANQNLNLFAGPAFHTYTFTVAPRISLLDNQLQIYATAEGRHGKTHTDNGMQWGHVYNNSKASRLENDPVWLVSDRLNPGGSFTWTKNYFDASFWKLREVGARYTLPQAWVQRTGAERASVAFSARNLWTIWVAQSHVYGAKVGDPEYGTPFTSLGGNFNYWEVPPLTSLNVTLRVTL